MREALCDDGAFNSANSAWGDGMAVIDNAFGSATIVSGFRIDGCKKRMHRLLTRSDSRREAPYFTLVRLGEKRSQHSLPLNHAFRLRSVIVRLRLSRWTMSIVVRVQQPVDGVLATIPYASHTRLRIIVEHLVCCPTQTRKKNSTNDCNSFSLSSSGKN